MRGIVGRRPVSALATGNVTGQSQEVATVAARIRDKLLSRLDPQLDISDISLVRQTLAEMFPRILEE